MKLKMVSVLLVLALMPILLSCCARHEVNTGPARHEVNTEQPQAIVDDALKLLEAKDYEGAWRKIEPYKDDTRAYVRDAYKKIKTAYVLYHANVEVTEAYNTGDGEKALALIYEYEKKGVTDQSWLALKEKIKQVIAKFAEAKKALDAGDLLTARKLYAQIIELEPAEGNAYRAKAVAFIAEFDQMSWDQKADLFIEYAKKRLKAEDYKVALDTAKAADDLYEDGSKEPGKEIRMAVNGEGSRRLQKAQALQDKGEYKAALDMYQEIKDKHIYADDDNGTATLNVCNNNIAICQAKMNP